MDFLNKDKDASEWLTKFSLYKKPFIMTFLSDTLPWMYKEIMMNDDNLESNLLTSSLLKIHSLYKFC